MYIPNYHKNENPEELKSFIKQNGFAIVVSTVENSLWATHIPLILTEDNKLSGHISRGNKQWKNFNNETEVLAIFSGPHTYVSSSWYDHENVPSWNYIAVHVYGKIRIIEGEELLNSLRQLTDKYEKHSVKPVSVDTMSEKFLKNELRGVVGFEIAITKMEAAYKLSQNRDAKNHENIIAELEKRNDPASTAIASEMKKAGHS